VRGGKDNFGIVTAIEFGLFEVPSLYGGAIFFPGELAGDVLHAYRQWAPTLPEAMTASIALMRLPALDIVPEPLRDRLTVHVRIAYLGPEAEGARLVEPIRRVGTPIIDTVGEMEYRNVGRIHSDPPTPLPLHEGSLRLAEFPERAAEAILSVAGPQSDSTLTMVELRPLGGALSREPEVPNAVGGRDAAYQVFCAGVGGSSAACGIYEEIDEVFRGLRPWACDGGTLNYAFPQDTAQESVREIFGTAAYDRLRQIKRSVDPENLFRINHNIPPAAFG
jgi:hypothetical protein